MNLGEKIYLYCERGQDPSFWAEPLNALSNAAFLIAALVATRDYLAVSPERRTLAPALLIALTCLIGAGSFLFHTFATRWASLADQIPIAIFMLAYFAFLIRRILGLSWIYVAVALVAFYATIRYAGTIQCDYGALLPVTSRTGARCLNGTVGYLPAFLALVGSSIVVARYPAGKSIALAAAVFLVSMTFRSIDIEICELTSLGGHLRGSHFVWHMLNGLTLYILLRAAISHEAARPEPLPGGAARV